MSSKTVICWSCSRSWEFTPPLARSESCENCGWDAKVCKNCKFYDASSYRECKEDQAELVKDKDRRNFCTWFEPNGSGHVVGKTPDTNPLDQLFGGVRAPKVKSKLEEELDSFFKK